MIGKQRGRLPGRFEALAAGVPVIASRLASTPEVIRHGETGFLCDSVDEMVAAIHRVGMLSREVCRQDVVQRFGPDTFIARVEALIARALVP
jgi:glycosyltransferase involved in cell wall biosynthesis